MLTECGSTFTLPPTSFVFMNQGHEFLYFDCDGSEDPAIWRYVGGDDEPRPVANRFSMWFRVCVIDEVAPNSSDTMQ